MNRRSIPLLLLLPMLAAGCSHHAASAGLPATPVVVAPVQVRDVTLTDEWVATLDGYVNANISPQVSGYIIRQDYAEGAVVKKGQVLFEIDPRPFQAALDQARGQLAQAQSQVAQAQAQIAQQQAQLGTYNLNVKRDVPEAAAHAIPQSQLESDQHSQAAAQAAVAAAQATLQAQRAAVETAQAMVEQAQLNLGFTQVRSLIDGVAGIAQVQIGNLVSPQTVLTAVSQLDPIKAYFPIDAQEYARSISAAPGYVDLLAPGRTPLQLILADGRVFPHPGRVLFADRQVDAQTGTLRLAAAFPNPGNRLRPGEYARVRAATRILHCAILVPQTAVSQLQNEYQVAVVAAGNRVSVRAVDVGETTGNDWIINSGLKPGETVVAEGVAKVHDGALVRPVPATATGAGR